MGTSSVSLVGNGDVVVVYMYFAHVPHVYLCSKQAWSKYREELRPEHEEFTEAMSGASNLAGAFTRPGGTLCTFWVAGLQTADHSGDFSYEPIILLVRIFRPL